MFFRFILAIAIAMPLSFMNAQDVSILDTLNHEIVITDQKLPIPSIQSTKTILIFDKSDIELSGVNDMSQLLDRLPGVRVNGSNSNAGLNKSTFIQGGSSDDVLFLIDGMPLNDPSAIGGAFDIRNLSLSGVERVEVLKGSQSTLYGSNAISGVINIITTGATTEGWNITGQAAISTYSTAQYGLSSQYTSDKSILRINGSYDESEGLSEARNLMQESIDFDNDGYDRSSLNIDWAYKLNESLQIRPFYRYNSFNSSFDAGSFTDSGDSYTSNYWSTGGTMSLNTDNHQGQLLYSYTDTDRSFNTAFGISDFDGRHHNIDLFDRIWLAEHSSITAGINYQHFGMKDPNATQVDPTDNVFSPYLLYSYNNHNLNASIGYRLTSNSRFGTNSSYETSASYFIASQLKVLASYSTGFKAPLLSQLFGAFGANEELTPQESRYISGGLAYESNGIDVGISYFTRSIDDIIIFGSDPQSGAFLYLNANQQKDMGFEFNVAHQSDDWGIRASYIFLTGETLDADANLQSDVLIRRPKHQFDIGLSYSGVQNLNISLDFQNTGERIDRFFDFTTFQTNETTLDSYGLFNLRAVYQINEAFRVFGSVQNLFNKGFEELAGYNSLGRYTTIGIRFKVI